MFAFGDIMLEIEFVVHTLITNPISYFITVAHTIIYFIYTCIYM